VIPNHIFFLKIHTKLNKHFAK